jgi:hypothetical protein
LFDRDSDFFQKVNEVLTEGMVNEDMQYMVHPYTDVYALRGKFDFSCINFAVGYYNYHTKHEYVIVEDVFNTLDIAKKMINDLGNVKYFEEVKSSKFLL